jgi:hypothetical protein
LQVGYLSSLDGKHKHKEEAIAMLKKSKLPSKFIMKHAVFRIRKNTSKGIKN